MLVVFLIVLPDVVVKGVDDLPERFGVEESLAQKLHDVRIEIVLIDLFIFTVLPACFTAVGAEPRLCVS